MPTPAFRLTMVICATLVLATMRAGTQSLSSVPTAPPVVLVNVTVIDGRGGPPLADQVVVIRDGRIAQVGPRARAAIPRGAQVVDLKGHYVLPGLGDAHAHLGADKAAIEKYLRFLFGGGITAVRDMAGDSHLYAELSPQARGAEVPVPRIFYSANWAGPSFWDDRRWVGSTQGRPPCQVPCLRRVQIRQRRWHESSPPEGWSCAAR